MSATNKIGPLVLAALVLGFLGGYWFRTQSDRWQQDHNEQEIVRSLQLSDAALKTSQFVMLLKGLHEANPDVVRERLETLLDFSLIDLARDYSPQRDHFGTASNALSAAKVYRTAHPHRSELKEVAQQVDAALQIEPTGRP